MKKGRKQLKSSILRFWPWSNPNLRSQIQGQDICQMPKWPKMGQKHHFHREIIEKSDFWDLRQSPKTVENPKMVKNPCPIAKIGFEDTEKPDFGYWIFEIGYPNLENSTKFCLIQDQKSMDLKNLGWIWSKSMILKSWILIKSRKTNKFQKEFGVFLIKIEKSIPGNGFSILETRFSDP